MPYASTPYAVYPDLTCIDMDELDQYMADAGRGDDYAVVHVPDDIVADGEEAITDYCGNVVYGNAFTAVILDQ